jgi:hypothetical protein
MSVATRPLVLLAALCTSALSSAQTLTVCELLRGLEDLNHTEVTVRGTWIAGHVGEVLIPTEPCGRATIRDGWIWQDAVELAAATREAGAFLRDYYRLLETKRGPDDVKIVATLTGRLETRDHFKAENGRPVAFSYYVAVIRYTDATDLEIVPYKPGEIERELEFRKHPAAKRIKEPKR